MRIRRAREWSPEMWDLAKSVILASFYTIISCPLCLSQSADDIWTALSPATSPVGQAGVSSSSAENMFSNFAEVSSAPAERALFTWSSLSSPDKQAGVTQASTYELPHRGVETRNAPTVESAALPQPTRSTSQVEATLIGPVDLPHSIRLRAFSPTKQQGISLKELEPREDTAERSDIRHSIRVAQLETAHNGAANSPTLTLLRFEPQNSSKVAGMEGEFTVAEMKGPLTNATVLFSDLRIENPLSGQPVTMGEDTRTTADASGYDTLWPREEFTWVTATFNHKPLYFEQVNMERYGYGPRPCFKPVLSAAHFFGSIAIMPYKLLTQHPCEQVYTLGHQRPGSCARYQRRSLLGQSYPCEVTRYFMDYPGYR